MESKARGPIGKAVDKAVAYLTEHPDEARYTDSMARAVVVEGLRCRVEGPTGETLETDMPTGIGGGGAAPSPGWFLRAAVASCVASLAAIRAAQLGVALSRTEVEVDSESDDRGILGISAEVRAGPLSSRITVRLAADRSTQTRQLEAIGRWAVDHCPVSDALRRAIPLETRFERI